MSGALVSFIARIVLVAGQAMPIRIRNGITVQTISTVVFSWNCTALCPTDLRCLKIEKNITPKTAQKMITHIQKM